MLSLHAPAVSKSLDIHHEARAIYRPTLVIFLVYRGSVSEMHLRGRSLLGCWVLLVRVRPDRKSTRLNSSHSQISYSVFCLIKKIVSPLSQTSPRSAPPPLVFSLGAAPT